MSNYQFETLAIRSQQERSNNREHSAPIYLTSSFVFDNAAHGADLFSDAVNGHKYSRYSNPNTDEFVEKLCLLEHCETGIATASGMAAVYNGLIAHLGAGDHIVLSRDIFSNTAQVVKEIFPNFGITHTIVDVEKNEDWAAAIQKNTKIVYVETPSNPSLKTADLSFISGLCKAHDIIFVVDNCFATPYLQQPARWGADLVIHSATKYIDGQGRVLGGAILGNAALIEKCALHLKRTGPCLSPFNAWVLSKSLETLGVRMDRHCDNALEIATFLKAHPKINNVYYPHLESYNRYDLAKKQMKKGGGLVAFEIDGDTRSGAQFLDCLKIHSLTANLGDCRSIATHPASTTHSKLSPEEQLAMDITPGFIRLSVGLENVSDLITDLDQALDHI